MKSPEQLPEDRVARAAAGDASARAEVLAGLERRIRRLARRAARRWPGVAAEDLAQEGVVAVLTALPRFDPRDGVPFSSYVHVAIRRRMRDFARRMTREEAAADDWDPTGVIDPASLPDGRPSLSAPLASLPARQRRVLELHYGLRGGREHTFEEIGALFGVRKQTVERLHRVALRALRRRLGE